MQRSLHCGRHGTASVEGEEAGYAVPNPQKTHGLPNHRNSEPGPSNLLCLVRRARSVEAEDSIHSSPTARY